MRKGTGGSPGRPRGGRFLAGLEGLSFFLADAPGGLGAFLGISLLDEPGGNVATLGGVATLIAQIPAGVRTERTRHTRTLLAGAAVLVCLGALLLTLPSRCPLVAAASRMIGAAALFFPLANGAMLPIASQKLATYHAGQGALLPAALIIVLALAVPQSSPIGVVVSS